MLCKCLDGTRCGICRGVGDGENGDHDYGVHDTVESFDACVTNSDDEGRRTGIEAALVGDEALIGVGDQQAYNCDSEDIEDGDAPENLFDSGRKCLRGVLCFSCCQTNKFCSRETKCCYDKDIAEPFEAIVEGSYEVLIWSMNESVSILPGSRQYVPPI